MKRFTLSASFLPGADSTPVDTSTPHGVTVCTASATLSGSSPPARIIRIPSGISPDERPVEEVPRPGARAVDEDACWWRATPDSAIRGEPAANALTTKRTALATVGDRVGRLVAVELGPLDAGAVHDLDHPLGMLVAEHADRHDLGREPTGDVVDLLHRHLPRRTGRTRNRRVGAHGHREQRVVLAGDAADLHEHAMRTVPVGSAPGPVPSGVLSDPAPAWRHPRRSARSVATGSGAVTSVSPTSSASKPASARRRASSRVADARLGDLDDAGRDGAAHPGGALVVDLERQQVALVDADERGPGDEGALQLRLVVDLDEHVEADRGGQLVELDQLEVGERGDDEQHAVGAHQSGVGDVAGVDREVLAQHRERRGVARRAQVGDRPGEELGVGEHRQAGGTTVGVGAGERRRIEVAVEVALRRRAALDLGDDGQLARVGEGDREAAGGAETAGRGQQVVEVAIVGGGRLPVALDDAVEVRHRLGTAIRSRGGRPPRRRRSRSAPAPAPWCRGRGS